MAGKKEFVEEILGIIREEFDVTFRGPIDGKTFLGRRIKHSVSDDTLVVTVTDQIEKALKRHQLVDTKPLHLPIQPGIKYTDWTGTPVRPMDYLSAVGSLLFIATTRPDVQFAVGVASRFSVSPGPEHWKLVTRISPTSPTPRTSV
jgi:hypothetical protein